MWKCAKRISRQACNFHMRNNMYSFALEWIFHYIYVYLGIFSNGYQGQKCSQELDRVQIHVYFWSKYTSTELFGRRERVTVRAGLAIPRRLPQRGDGRRWKKEKNKNYSWYSAQGPGRMAQTPQTDTGDSVSRFRHSRCSTLFNYNSYFPVGGQFCFQLLFTA